MLEDLQKAHPKRLKIWYTLDRPPKKWAYGEGFITEEASGAIRRRNSAAQFGAIRRNSLTPCRPSDLR